MDSTTYKNELNINIEDQILVLCAQKNISNQNAIKISTLSKQNPDWLLLLKKAGRHKLLSLLHLNLNLHAQDSVPPKIFKTLQRYIIEIAKKNFCLTNELIKIVKLLKSKNITPILYKGPILSLLAYNDVTFRQFGDLDVFVEKKDLLTAQRLLVTNGYNIINELPHINFNFLTKTLHQKNFCNKIVNLDIHWQIEQQDLFNHFLYFDRMQIDLNSCSVESFTIENLVLLLTIHCCNHRWETLSSLCDIAFLCENNSEIDWKQIIIKANKLHLKKILAATFFLIHNLLQFEIAVEMKNFISTTPSAKKLAEFIQKKVFFSKFSLNLIDKTIFIVKSNDNFGRGIKELICFFTRPTEREFKIILPKYFYFLYSILRPIFLVKDFLCFIKNKKLNLLR